MKKLNHTENSSLQKVGLILKLHDEKTLQFFRHVFEKMEKLRQTHTFYLEEAALARLKENERSLFEKASLHQMAKTCSLIIVVGGDGTILRCTRELLHADDWKTCAVLGINSGRVGFLASLNASEAEKHLFELLHEPDRLVTESRSCLQLSIENEETKTKRYHVINDIVLSKGTLSRIFEFEVRIDSEFLSSYRSDGLIISPPTGSTAYNLAAGGSIVEPGIPAIQLTPIAPQYFSTKPVLVSDQREISVKLLRHSTDVFITLDGQTGFRVKDEDRVRVTRSEKSVQFLVPKETQKLHFFNSLRDKLKWGLTPSRD